MTIVGKDKKLTNIELFTTSKADITKKWHKKYEKLELIKNNKVEVKQLNPIRTKIKTKQLNTDLNDN